MLRSANHAAEADKKARAELPFLWALATAAAIEVISGVTGMGGGIFLAPVVLSLGWVAMRQASAVSAVYNLMNSAAALSGAWASMPSFPAEMPLWLGMAALGALTGSWLGISHLSAKTLRYVLTALLLAAGIRMIIA